MELLSRNLHIVEIGKMEGMSRPTLRLFEIDPIILEMEKEM